MKYSDIVKHCLKHGGITYSVKNSQIYSGDGYISAINKSSEKSLDLEYFKLVGNIEIYEFVEKNNFLNHKDDLYLGIWVDKPNSQVYIDAVKEFKDEESAIAYAKKHDQISIYNTAKKELIYI